MPTFIDRHPIKSISLAARRQMHLEAVRGIRDPSGTLPLGQWLEDGAVFCVLEAPDGEAVCRHHTARCVACDDVQLIERVTARRPLSDTDGTILRAEIVRIWHTPA